MTTEQRRRQDGRRRLRALSDEQVWAAARRYAAGEAVIDIAADLSVVPNTIRHWLFEHEDGPRLVDRNAREGGWTLSEKTRRRQSRAAKRSWRARRAAGRSDPPRTGGDDG